MFRIKQRALASHLTRFKMQQVFVLLVLGSMWLAGGCSSASSLQIMANQPRYDVYEESDFFADGSSSRPVISDTVTYQQPLTNTLLYTGQTDGQDATTYPFPITDEVMARGQERFNVFCAPCHGRVGDGNGIVAQRGFCCVASLLQDRLREAPPGHFFDVITNGIGTMPSYAFQIPERDRWAIIAYTRALQLSQNATLDDVPMQERDGLNGATPVP